MVIEETKEQDLYKPAKQNKNLASNAETIMLLPDRWPMDKDSLK